MRAFGYDYYGNLEGSRRLCGATYGWPRSFCRQNPAWTIDFPICDTTRCSIDCQAYGQNGGYCEEDKCMCFKQVLKPKMVENKISGKDSDNSV